MIPSKECGLLRPVAAAALGIVVGFVALAAEQPAATGVYTVGQARDGRAVFERDCASCHQTNLQGSFEAPQLAGDSFLNFWGDLTTRQLFERIRSSMPPDRPGALGDEAYLSVVAYILEANGAPAGSEVLTTTTVVSIGSVASGQTVSVAQNLGSGQTQAAPGATPIRSRWRYRRPARWENYRPVTNELLRDPDPGDWLMIRRNYEAWSHSPLTEITRDNVDELELAWVWSMNEGGWNAPSPIAHDGVLYLAGIGPVVQALDAATGDLIWENQVGVATPGYSGTSRNFAIYENTLFLATPDARIVALDAGTGEEVWSTEIADQTEGFRNTSGPIVVGGKVVQGLSGCDRFTRAGCFVSAYDAANGEQLWRFNTVARSDEPGGNTWAGVPDFLRAGGATPGSPPATTPA